MSNWSLYVFLLEIIRMTRLEHVFSSIDELNAQDPHFETVDGINTPKELVYGMRMSEWLDRIRPDAPDPLKVAVRAQHIMRWKIPRSSFADGKIGYLNWRNALKKFHADEAAKILDNLGFQKDFIDRVSFLIQKKNLKNDPDTQSLEDVACLVFLQFYFAEFSSKTDTIKMIDIVKKTWNKMSDDAKGLALNIAMPPECLKIVEAAII